MKTVVWFCISAFCLLIAGCPFLTTVANVSQPLTFEHFKVKFQNPDASGSQLEIPATPSCPVTSKNPGCVRFGPDEFGAISFELLGQGGGSDPKKCSDSGSVKWVITKIEGTDDGDSETFKGNDSGWGTNFAPWVEEAFYPIKDSSTGVFYEQSWDNGSTIVTIINKNNHPVADGKKILYYRVTATECDESHATKASDPGVENEGLN